MKKMLTIFAGIVVLAININTYAVSKSLPLTLIIHLCLSLRLRLRLRPRLSSRLSLRLSSRLSLRLCLRLCLLLHAHKYKLFDGQSLFEHE